MIGGVVVVNSDPLAEALGWQQHTTRAALSRLRSAGFEIKREVPKSGGAARYRIAAEPAA